MSASESTGFATPTDESVAGLVARLREAHQDSPQRIVGSNIFDEAATALSTLAAERGEALTTIGALNHEIGVLNGEVDCHSVEEEAFEHDLALERDLRTASEARATALEAGIERLKAADEAAAREAFILHWQERNRAELAEAQLARAREALGDCVETLALVEEPSFVDPAHGDEVKRLGDRIGYGALMSSASASWIAALERQGYSAGGAFVAGPCLSTVQSSIKRARQALRSPAPADGRGDHQMLASASCPQEPTAGERIADAVLTWMVERELLDADNEYDAADVVTVLNEVSNG